MKIVIADPMEPEVVAEIGKLGTVVNKPSDLKIALSDADVLIVRSATKVTEELLQFAPKLRIVGRAGVGLDNVDRVACEKRNIQVINTPDASTQSVAELTITMILCMLRNVAKGHFQMKNKIWDKKNLTGREIAGKTLGIIGLGRIGHAVSEKALALGMKVQYYSRHKDPEAKANYVSLDELLSTSDIISLHLSSSPETKEMMNFGLIGKMKDGAYLVNLARGDLVNEDALYSALTSGKLAGAALDVYSSEPYSGKLLELDNVVFTPHLGASTKEAQERIGIQLVERLRALMLM